MKNKTIYFAIIFVLFVSLGIFGLQKDNIAKADTIYFEDEEYTVYFYVGLNKSRYTRGETAYATMWADIYCNNNNNNNNCVLSNEDEFSGAVTIAGKEYSLFTEVPISTLGWGYYWVYAPIETTSGTYNATFDITKNWWDNTQQAQIPYDVYALTNWSSSNSSIITINNNGYAEAKAAGQAKITVTYKNMKAALNIVVSAVPTCSDNIKNQGETGVDCGGPCPSCATCSDNIKNQGETGVDCGGPCPSCPKPIIKEVAP